MYELETSQGATLLRVSGAIDDSSKAAFREVLDFARLNAAGQIIVVLDDCPYFDAAGIGVLMQAHNAWGTRLSVSLPGAGIVRRVFAVTGVDRVFNVKDSIVAPMPALVLS